MKTEKCYFTDRHDAFDTVLDRVKAFHRDRFIELREPVWRVFSNEDKMRMQRLVAKVDGKSTWPDDSKSTRHSPRVVYDSKWYPEIVDPPCPPCEPEPDYWEYHIDDLPMSMRTRVVLCTSDKEQFQQEAGDEWPSDDTALRQVVGEATWWSYSIDELPVSCRLRIPRFGRPSLRQKTLPTPRNNKCKAHMLPCAAPRCPHAVVKHLKALLVTKSPHLHRLLRDRVQNLKNNIASCTIATTRANLHEKLEIAESELKAVLDEYKLNKGNSKERVIDLQDREDTFFGPTEEARRLLCWRINNQCIFGHTLDCCRCDEGVDVWHQTPESPCLWNHNSGVCRCHLPVLRFGQDEAIFHSSLIASAYWRYKKRIKMVKKSKGTACMVSAVVDELLGFGLPLTQEQLAEINQSRTGQVSAVTGKKKLMLTRSPGIVSICPGKTGRWDLKQLKVQAEDVQDCYAVVASGYQVVGSYDNSNAHSQKQCDGLLMTCMSMGIGGNQRCLRDTTILEGCLDNYPANMYKDAHGQYLPTTTPPPAAAVQVENCLLQVGDVQQGVFHPDQVWLFKAPTGEWCVGRRVVDASDDDKVYVRTKVPKPGQSLGLHDRGLKWTSLAENKRIRSLSVRDIGDGMYIMLIFYS